MRVACRSSEASRRRSAHRNATTASTATATVPHATTVGFMPSRIPARSCRLARVPLHEGDDPAFVDERREVVWPRDEAQDPVRIDEEADRHRDRVAVAHDGVDDSPLCRDLRMLVDEDRVVEAEI